MRRRCHRFFILLCLLGLAGPLHAELHQLLKPHADGFNQAMQSYEGNRIAIIEVERTGYLAVLKALKTRLERAGKNAEVAAIDAEIKAVSAGPLTGEPRADLPEELHRYRKNYVDAPAKAAKAIASAQKFARESYLHSLDGLTEAARRGKSPELEADVQKERERVRAQVEAVSEQAKEKPAVQTKEKPKGGGGSSASQGQP